MVDKIIWPPVAQKQLFALYVFISKSSLQNAEKVRKAILASTRQLTQHPEMHRPDKYRINKDKRFRVYEIYHYRITYQITETEIIIVRIRHTKMSPLKY